MLSRIQDLEAQLEHELPLGMIADDTDEYIRRSLVVLVRTHCEAVEITDENLNNTGTHLLERLNGYTHDQGGRSNAAVQGELRAWRQSLEHVLQRRVFMYMPKEAADYYRKQFLFGNDVAERFPEANREIMFAGNCFAIEAYTACVFHLTRAVEIAARVMVSSLKVSGEIKRQGGKRIPVKLATWEDLIVALQKGVAKKQAKISTSTKRKDVYEFYNHAVSQFRNFKDAWRNKVSHKRKTYLAGEATDIMNNVRQFMEYISTELSEPKGATVD